MNNTHDDLDVIIVGAGISGISAACHIERECPDKRYLILEAREQIGGTWDLFRYPGIRSDSDMHTFGFAFKPWTRAKTLADGPAILDYLREATAEDGVEDKIRFGHRVTSANFSSKDNVWNVQCQNQQGQDQHFRARLLFMCNGYYRYDAGYTPEIPGLQDFTGTLIHPQHWPDELDYSNKRVVVIGSGATAVTLVPAMAERAAKVTMVQRSPTWIASMPSHDRLVRLVNKLLPSRWAYALIRWRNIHLQNYVYRRARRKPESMKRWLLRRTSKLLRKDFDLDTHLTPNYDPWTQRLCLVPDADLFAAINRGKADIVTGAIERITADGVLMHSGELVPADILITATGLQLQMLGGAKLFLDGKELELNQHLFYLGMMFSGVPNLLLTFGYINASWTLRADLNSQFACALLKHMDRVDAQRCTPTLKAEEKAMPSRDWITDFNPGYMQRGLHLMPKQGDHQPWLNTQNYLQDRKLLIDRPLEDGNLLFE